MNIFDKYINNLNENSNLYRKIEKLCGAYLMNGNGIRMSMSHRIAAKVVKWEFTDTNSYYPREIKITYISIDANTMEKSEESLKINWSELLIGEEITEESKNNN